MSADCQERKLAGPFASAIANHRDPANSDLAPNPVLYYRIATLKICVIRTVHTRQNRIERLATSNAKSPPDPESSIKRSYYAVTTNIFEARFNTNVV